MNILITGSNGFLGQNLISLIKQKHPNWGITGIDKNPISVHNYNFIQMDFQSPIPWTKYFDDINPDYIIHTVGVFKTSNNNLMFNINVGGFFQFIDAIRLSKHNPKMIIIGSSAEYRLPKNDENPIDEKHQLFPTSLYGLTKKWQEEIGLFYNKTYGMDIVCTRPSNFIGKGVSSTLLPGYLSSQFKQNHSEIPIEITALESIRDYIDIRDVCNALLGLIQCNKCKGEIFNISSSKGITNSELIKTFEDVSNKKAKINNHKLKANCLVLSNNKIKKYVEWTNKYKLEESVKWCISD